MGKNKFINKKNSATFQLLARDTSDPNYSSGPSGDRVFVRVDNNAYEVKGLDEVEPPNDINSSGDPNCIFADAPEDYDDNEYGVGYGYSGNSDKAALPDHVRREIIELGFPDDGYNYLFHLREIKNAGGGSVYYQNPKANLYQLPPDVKAYNASRVEITDVNDESDDKAIYAVASKTADARIDKVVDDEIAALLDDTDLSRFGSDMEDLEEDFVVKANLPEGPVHSELDKKLRMVEKLGGNTIENNDLGISKREESAVEFATLEDEKPRVRRPIDEQFDLLERQEYGTDSEDEYGGYNAEEDECQESMIQKFNQAFKDCSVDCLRLDDKYIVPSDLPQDKKGAEDLQPPKAAADVISRCREYAEKYANESEDEKQVIFEESSDESEVWDCETIVSTYSNLDNHPGKIEAPEIGRKKILAETISGALSSHGNIISLKGKEKLPVDFLPGNRKYSTDKVKDVNNLKPEQQKRKQHGQESKEEKKERKAAVKEERREARRVKKEMKGLYNYEGQRAQRVAAFTGPSSIHLM